MRRLLAVAVLVSLLPAPSAVAAELSVIRLAGADRYATAVVISQFHHPDGADVVFVATGATFPDGLTGAAVAGAGDAPLLLTGRDDLPAVTRSEIERLQPLEIVVLGGTAAIGAAVESELGGLAPVTRLGGLNRYATAVSVSQYGYPGTASTVVVATGRGFADALAGGPAAVALGGPLLITEPGFLPEVIAAEIARLAPDQIVLLGGSAAVSESVEAELGELAEVIRIQGADRYATAVAISEFAFGGADVVYAATGRDFPDALAGAAAAGAVGSPILLTSRYEVPFSVRTEVVDLGASTAIVLGGLAVIGHLAEHGLTYPEVGGIEGATIPELQQAMEDGPLTATALTAFYLARILDLDHGPNAMLALNPNAMTEAAALDALRQSGTVLGPLHGIPVVVKDNIGTVDMPTTAGSLSLAGFVPVADATQVARMREAGAIILGKTNLYEFARDIESVSSLGGTTRNPYDLGRNPGGSSAGTGAAVAADFAAGGLGTDTCGSIRIPAAFNHLYGLRPTVGLSPTDGVIPLSFTEDTVGPLARSVIDLAVLLDVTADSGSLYSSAAAGGTLEGVRIGVLDVIFTGDAVMLQTTRDALDLMEAHGAEVVPAPIPNFNALRGNATSVFLWEWRTAMDDYLAGQPEAPYDTLAAIDASGLYLSALAGLFDNALAVSLDSPAYHDALQRRAIVQDAIEGWMDDHDLDALAYPAITRVPALLGASQSGNNCGTASVGGLPAIVVPAGFTSQGWPVGLELMGRRWSEETLLAIAAGYELVAPERVAPPLGE